ncbi:hypothetical protein [Streptomyces pseudoechinosporeus]
MPSASVTLNWAAPSVPERDIPRDAVDRRSVRANTLVADGKSARGSRHDDTPGAHVLAAKTGEG